jgi:hypothetical protein
LIQWRKFNVVHNIDQIAGYTEKIKHKNGVYFVIAFQDDIDDNVIYFEEIELKENTNDSMDLALISYKTVIEKMCDCNYHKDHKDHDMIQGNEWMHRVKQWIIDKTLNVKNGTAIFEYEINYKFLSNALSNVESLFDINTMNCAITILTSHNDTFQIPIYYAKL